MKKSTGLRFLWAFLGISAIIITHELGHWSFCKLFGVSAPEFSIGLGPRIFETKFAGTRFSVSLLLLGGYVDILGLREPIKGFESISFATKPFYQKTLILLGGIIFNLLFALCIFAFLRRPKLPIEENTDAKKPIARFIGPIGIISLVAKSSEYGVASFFFILAVLSLNLAIFNLIPLPILDGGQLLILALEKWGNFVFREETYEFLMLIALLFITLLFFFLSSKDIKRALT